MYSQVASVAAITYMYSTRPPCWPSGSCLGALATQSSLAGECRYKALCCVAGRTMPKKLAVPRSCCFTQARPLYQTLRQPTEQEKALPGPDGKFGRYCFQPGGRWASKHLPACTELAPTKRDIAAVGGAVADGAAKNAVAMRK